MSHFDGRGLVIDGLVFLSPREVQPFLEGNAILVDLREEMEKNGREFQVKTRVSLPWRRFEEESALLPRDRPLILADCVGIHSKEAARLLLSRGYEQVASLIGGMVDWLGDGLPVVTDHGEQLTGSCTCQLRPAKAYRLKSGC